MSLPDYLREDFASFDEWRSWAPETLASYVTCLVRQWEAQCAGIEVKRGTTA